MGRFANLQAQALRLQRRQERAQIRQLRDRARTIIRLRGEAGWKEIVAPYMDEIKKLATKQVMRSVGHSHVESFLKGRASAFEDLNEFLDSIVAAHEQAQKDEKDSPVENLPGGR